MSSVNCEKQKAKWSYIQSRECRSRAALELAASDEERVPEIHFQNRKTSLQQQYQSTRMTKKSNTYHDSDKGHPNEEGEPAYEESPHEEDQRH